MNINNFNQLKIILERYKNVKILAVTKYSNIDEINDAIEKGIGIIGENRVEIAELKFQNLKYKVEKHFIGNIQTKKILKIVQLFDVIESVSKIEHLNKINLISSSIGKKIHVFLQFNISLEEQKTGFLEEDIDSIIQIIPSLKNIKITGVMGMGSNSNSEINRKEFKKLKAISDILKNKYDYITEISMGMSNDYLIALEEGSTLLRLGTLLFK